MKQVEKTGEVLNALRASYGADANLDALTVFEVIASNSLPLRKSKGIYAGAVNTAALHADLAAWMGRESVPVQVQHNTETQPFGRAFHGKVTNGGSELRALIALDNTVHPDVVAKCNSGTLDQVSIGILPKSVTCSKCGWDYLSAAATHDNFYSATCGNGHSVGEDDTHVFVNSADLFFELSLVGCGAVKGARIVGASDSVFQRSEPLRMAASATNGIQLGVEIVPTPVPTPKDTSVTPEMLAAYTASITDAATLKAQAAPLQAALDAANLQLTAVSAELATLQAGSTDVVALTASVEASNAALADAVVALKAEANGMLVALGEADPKTPDTVAELVAMIGEKRALFAAAIPINGASAAAIADVGESKPAARSASPAFRSPPTR
jgi:hypothetical protein